MIRRKMMKITESDSPSRKPPFDSSLDEQPEEHDGISRLPYFLSLLGILFLNALVTAGSHSDSSALFSLILLIVVAFRLKNIGMSGWWALLGLVPIANLWIGYICLVHPPGYSQTVELDDTGKTIRAIFVGGIVLMIILAILFGLLLS